MKELIQCPHCAEPDREKCSCDEGEMGLFSESSPVNPDFDGVRYDSDLDRERLSGQILDVYNDILDRSGWLTVQEIALDTGHPEPSISAQLRNLRKDRFGGFNIVGRYRKETRIFEYKLGGDSE